MQQEGARSPSRVTQGVQKCQKISLGAEQALHPAAWHAGYGMEPLDVTLAQGIPSLMAPPPGAERCQTYPVSPRSGAPVPCTGIPFAEQDLTLHPSP